jgi:tetratricopeptide (TPR) repeat protein
MVFSRLFGKKNPLDRLRRAVGENRWADALRLSEDMDLSALSPREVDEAQSLAAQAGDALARINLDEGRACLRMGEAEKGQEHLELALSQVRDQQLRREIEEILIAEPASTASVAPAGAASHCGGGSCGSPGPASAPASQDASGLDEASRFELMLSSYPPDLAQRYAMASALFRQAFFAAHEGRTDEAFALYDQIPDQERDDLFYFERGSLAARSGDAQEARRDLAAALEANATHALALEALITLDLAENQLENARAHAWKGVETGTAAGFCLGRLAYIESREGNLSQALIYARQAMQAGPMEPDIVLLTASLLERQGELGEAERLLSALGGGGCKGGSSAYLAEFWLRHERNLDKALDAFNQAARQEPDNPRWMLRIGETYLARGWKKDGLALVNKALQHPRLQPEIKEAASKKLADLSTS